MPIADRRKIEEYYNALVGRKEDYVGVFFVGVKTTSVFCIATCRARKPKKENVEFFDSFDEALKDGYRPCKICKPTENANAAPFQVEMAISMVRNSPKIKIKDQQLRENDISPEVVRRWFKKNYGMTFQAYQRMYRVNNAYLELKHGKKATMTAYDNGFDSLSGFAYTYKKILGKSPRDSHQKNIILIHRFTTPLGPMFACASDKGICLLEFVDRRMLDTEFKDLQKLLNAQILVGENEHIRQVKREISEYFEGKRQAFNVDLDTPGTTFQREVWTALHQIPYGKTAAYQDQAQAIGNPKAVRAVARANGANRVAIIIPCHRVIGKNGQLTGYGGGLERKRWLLEHEVKNA